MRRKIPSLVLLLCTMVVTVYNPYNDNFEGIIPKLGVAIGYAF